VSGLTVLSGAEINNVLRGNIEKGLGFRISSKEKEIFRSLGGTGAPRIEWSTETGATIRDAAERLNLIQLSTEFYPSTRDEDLARRCGVKFDSQKDEGWSRWFREITLEKFLLPDTNILLKRTLSAVIFPYKHFCALTSSFKLVFEILSRKS
jgi:hypothetical protein